MDEMTNRIRYQHWADVIRECSQSGMSKHAYCQERGISEKQFYYYQHRIREIIAKEALQYEQTERATDTSLVPQERKPEIVSLRDVRSTQQEEKTVSIDINGISMSVPESVPVGFLSKLLEAAKHGAR